MNNNYEKMNFDSFNFFKIKDMGLLKYYNLNCIDKTKESQTTPNSNGNNQMNTNGTNQKSYLNRTQKTSNSENLIVATLNNDYSKLVEKQKKELSVKNEEIIDLKKQNEQLRMQIEKLEHEFEQLNRALQLKQNEHCNIDLPTVLLQSTTGNLPSQNNNKKRELYQKKKYSFLKLNHHKQSKVHRKRIANNIKERKNLRKKLNLIVEQEQEQNEQRKSKLNAISSLQKGLTNNTIVIANNIANSITASASNSNSEPVLDESVEKITRRSSTRQINRKKSDGNVSINKSNNKKPTSPLKQSKLCVTDTDTVVAVPSWRPKTFTATYRLEGIENITDENLLKRHQKPENEEKQIKKWDIRRQKEEMERLKLLNRNRKSIIKTNIKAKTQNKSTNNQMPNIYDIESIEVINDEEQEQSESNNKQQQTNSKLKIYDYNDDDDCDEEIKSANMTIAVNESSNKKKKINKTR